MGRGRHAAAAAFWSAARWTNHAGGRGLAAPGRHSHVLALSVPNLMAYDPAFAYEIAVHHSGRHQRMYVDGESIFYYLTVTNEPLPMPEMPDRPGRPATASSGPVICIGRPRRRCQAARPDLWQMEQSV